MLRGKKIIIIMIIGGECTEQDPIALELSTWVKYFCPENLGILGQFFGILGQIETI